MARIYNMTTTADIHLEISPSSVPSKQPSWGKYATNILCNKLQNLQCLYTIVYTQLKYCKTREHVNMLATAIIIGYTTFRFQRVILACRSHS